jgi:hypothetical protein
MAHRTEIMWIERKPDGVVGPARIGRVTFSKTGRSLHYRDQEFVKGGGTKSNYIERATGDEYWISGCHKDGKDALYSTTVEIDEDVRVEYWTKVRNKPEMGHTAAMKVPGKYPK